MLLFTILGAAPVGGDYGCMDCPDPNKAILSVAVLAVYFLIAIVIPFHLGRIRARNLDPVEPAARLARLSGVGWAMPVWLFAILAWSADYRLDAFLWWLAGTAWLSAGLGLASGVRAGHGDPSPLTAYAAVALAVASHFLWMGLGWSLSFGLALALLVSALLDLGPDARARLPLGWRRSHRAFSVAATVGGLLLIPSGPSWIGSY